MGAPVLQQVTHVFAGGGERRERRRLSKHRRVTDWLQKPGSRAVPGRYRGGSSPRFTDEPSTPNTGTERAA